MSSNRSTELRKRTISWCQKRKLAEDDHDYLQLSYGAIYPVGEDMDKDKEEIQCDQYIGWYGEEELAKKMAGLIPTDVTESRRKKINYEYLKLRRIVFPFAAATLRHEKNAEINKTKLKAAKSILKKRGITGTIDLTAQKIDDNTAEDELVDTDDEIKSDDGDNYQIDENDGNTSSAKKIKTNNKSIDSIINCIVPPSINEMKPINLCNENLIDYIQNNIKGFDVSKVNSQIICYFIDQLFIIHLILYAYLQAKVCCGAENISRLLKNKTAVLHTCVYEADEDDDDYETISSSDLTSTSQLNIFGEKP